MAGSTVRRAPYKDFLQPALHRRFASTAAILLAVSYFEALFLSSWESYFWAWFPIGWTGIRTLFIFSCGFFILILRIAHYHVGFRTTSFPVETALRYLPRLEALSAWAWYHFSSMLLTAIVLFGLPDTSNMQLVTVQSGDRARLNERPLFLLSFAAICAAYQTLYHKLVDLDRLDLGRLGRKNGVETLTSSVTTLFVSAIIRSTVASLVTSVVYPVFLRASMRSWALFFLRPFFNLPKTNIVPKDHPIVTSLLLGCIMTGCMLHVLWFTANYAFSARMVKEPLKNGVPLTSESKDPNGSLMNGLQNKKLSIQSFAMWELRFIADRCEDRRKAIFEDIDRKDGPVWSQIYVHCMSLIKAIESRIDAAANKAPQAPPSPSKVPEKRRYVAQPSRDNIVEPASRSFPSSMLEDIAKRPGRTPISQLSPVAKKALRQTRDRLLTKKQQEHVTPKGIVSGLQKAIRYLATLPAIGHLLRLSFARRLNSVLLDGPYAETTLYVNAIHSIGALAVKSLDEDQFGNVHRDVASIIRTFTSVIKKIEAFKADFPMHWTDSTDDRSTPEIDTILEALKDVLGRVTTSFERFTTELRLTLSDIRLAKEVAIPAREKEEPAEKNGPQMAQVR